VRKQKVRTSSRQISQRNSSRKPREKCRKKSAVKSRVQRECRTAGPPVSAPPRKREVRVPHLLLPVQIPE